VGEGAAGFIKPPEWGSGDARQPVGPRLVKGAMTRDGLPRNEMNAGITAGAHPHLIPVLGKLAAHPEEAHGLVMALIDSDFRNLAGPPSLDSCTRDVYPAEARFDLDAAIRIAHGIASAAEHLHAQGITHGDLYAHNILHGADGQALLGDFGAASFVPPDDPLVAWALQRIEVRAFACLLEELLALSALDHDSAVNRKKAQKLKSLQADCAQENVSARPMFPEIVAMLGALMQG